MTRFRALGTNLPGYAPSGDRRGGRPPSADADYSVRRELAQLRVETLQASRLEFARLLSAVEGCTQVFTESEIRRVEEFGYLPREKRRRDALARALAVVAHITLARSRQLLGLHGAAQHA